VRAAFLLALALALAAGRAHADAWESLHGRWTGAGEVNGMAAEVEFEFRETLDGYGRHLTFANRMTAKDGTERVFRAEALYLCNEAGVCRGHWYDSRGVVLPLAGVTHADRIVVDWGDTTTERGRTTYLVTPDRRLEVTDEVLGKDGRWKVFGRTTSRPAHPNTSTPFQRYPL
jgi:hypothetical protein